MAKPELFFALTETHSGCAISYMIMGGREFVVKLSAYKIRGIYGENRTNSADTEIYVANLLRQKILDAKISPCIIRIHILITYNDAKKVLSPYARRGDNQRAIGSICNNIDEGTALNKVSFAIMERAGDSIFSIGSWHTIGHIGAIMAKSMIFMVIYTMASIVDRIPTFQHGDLHINNILLKPDTKFDPTAPLKYMHFRRKKCDFYVPYYGLIPKIIDFGHSSVTSDEIISENAPGKITKATLRDESRLIYGLNYAIYGWAQGRYGSFDDTLGIMLAVLVPGLDAIRDPETKHLGDIEDVKVREDLNRIILSWDEMMRSALWNEYKITLPIGAPIIDSYGAD